MTSAGRAQFGIGVGQEAWNAALEAPAAVRSAQQLSDVVPVVDWAERRALAGEWAVLLVAYEAAPAFDPALTVHPPRGPVPLVWAASYRHAHPVTAPRGDAGEPSPVAWRADVSEAQFKADIARVRARIAAGDTYQVNYTFAMRAPFAADPWVWFEACARQAGVPFAACVDTGDAVVMSLSPELFLERRGDRVWTRPMKGTARRGRWLREDRALAEALAGSEKARAENVMIVDLLRNDLGRAAVTGSVRVRDLCRLERYPTVWQLTSTVEATLRSGTSLVDLLGATFPCGSVTGAPKVSTMAIIASLEAAPRGLYTGALMLLRPGGDLVSSVPIRTAVLDRRAAVATFSVGAGITADSDPVEEWAECLAKARVVRPPAVPVDADLFETMRLEAGVIPRLDRHLDRIAASAALFGWPCDRDGAVTQIAALRHRHPTGLWRVRLVLSRAGEWRATAVPFEDEPGPWRVGLAPTPVDTRSPLLFNKTTRRDVYDGARAARPGLEDVLLWNGRGEVTECTVGSVVAHLDGRRVTPPVACGLLPGVMREELLARGEVEEAVIRVEDLPRASGLWLVSSLRGWVPLTLVAANAHAP